MVVHKMFIKKKNRITIRIRSFINLIRLNYYGFQVLNVLILIISPIFIFIAGWKDFGMVVSECMSDFDYEKWKQNIKNCFGYSSYKTFDELRIKAIQENLAVTINGYTHLEYMETLKEKIKWEKCSLRVQCPLF